MKRNGMLSALALLLSAGAFAQNAIGTWNATVESQLGKNERTIVINDDMTGTYGGGETQYELSNVKMDGNQLTFDVTVDIQGQELPLKFAGTIDGDKLDGKFTSEMGEGAVTATRGDAAAATEKTPFIVGSWNVTSESQLGTLQRTLTVKEDMSGVYKSDEAEWPISNLKQDGQAVTFDVTVDAQGQELPLSFAGNIEGIALNGKFSAQGQEMATVTAKKDVGDEALVALADEIMKAITNKDVDTLAAKYADDFKGQDGSDKTAVIEFLKMSAEQGFLDGVTINTGYTSIDLEGDAAKIRGIELVGAFGKLIMGFDLAKRDGNWMVVSQSTEMGGA